MILRVFIQQVDEPEAGVTGPFPAFVTQCDHCGHEQISVVAWTPADGPPDDVIHLQCAQCHEFEPVPWRELWDEFQKLT